MEDAPKNVSKPEGLAPDGYVVPDKYQDRLIAPPVATAKDALQHDRQEPLGPVVVTLDAQDIGRMYAAGQGPYAFMQELLARMKQHGAPVEGTLRLRLAHGAVVKVKPDPGQQDAFFRYMWLPDEHVQALAVAGLKGAN